jgi:outer membrane protein OmpA-like peptidoglycan-associated protein
MNNTKRNPTFNRVWATLFLFPLLFSGCSLISPETRYDENTRIYTHHEGDSGVSNSGPRTTKYTNKTGGKKYTIGKYEEATDYYVNRQKSSDISPGERVVMSPATDMPANMTAEEQRASLPLVIEVSDVLFEFDKWVIKATFVPELDRWVEYFQNNPLVTAAIYGHTDSTGPETYNQKLSERRAEAVVNYMVERGIKLERLTPEGFGEAHPATSNDTLEGRQKNRRVELNF